MPAPGLQVSDFSTYPPQAASLAVAHLELIQQLPRVFAAVLLREVIGYDWKFPAERAQMEGQLRVLGSLTPSEFETPMQGFRAIRLNAELERMHWIADPAGFMEQMTAWLWSSGQMDAFRGAAEAYAAFLAQADPAPRPALPRLAIVVIGQGADVPARQLFRKLRPHGLYLSHVDPQDGWPILLAAVEKRAAGHTAGAAAHSYDHWYIDGGVSDPSASLTQVSYEGMARPRALLLEKIQQAIDSGSMGPEGLRSMIAKMQPDEIGLAADGSDATLSRFKLSLLTEGSGTQIFSTTFVQWAARECLRRAQPATLLLRYAPRQQMQPMNKMLSAAAPAAALDPQGSLIDADMGAYYTWINMNRLPGADQMSYLVWHQGSSQAIAMGPNLPQGTSSESRLDMSRVLALLG